MTTGQYILAPDAEGLVLDAATGRPVAGAEVRYIVLEAESPARTGEQGQFSLDGRVERRTGLVLPASGVYRDTAGIRVSASGFADGYATVGFINGIRPGLPSGPGPALYPAIVLMFPADSGETSLHALMQDCVEGPEQHHALLVVAYLASLDAADLPRWLTPNAAEGLKEHLGRVLPSSGFQRCARMSEAWALYRSQTEVLATVGGARYVSEAP